MSTYYIGIDPGGTTGLAYYLMGEIGAQIYTETVPIDRVINWLDDKYASQSGVVRIGSKPIECIAIEPFRTAGKLSSYGLATIDLVGQIKGWCHAMGVDYVLYPPQSRKAWMDDDEPTPHQQDAKAHLKHLLKNRGITI